MKIINDILLDFDDVLIRPKSSEMASRKLVDIVRKFNKFPHSKRTIECVPIMASNMSTTGTFEMSKSLAKRKWITCLHKHYTVEQLKQFYKENKDIGQYAWYSTGITDTDIQKIKDFKYHIQDIAQTPNICVDVANGYTDFFIEKVKEIRFYCPESIIMAGNVATHEQVEKILRYGTADIVKIGIGPGANCTTRLVTGVGYSQLSAILECADAAHGNPHGYVCADGGCKYSGDLCKAFGANSDFVMLGSMLAGSEECEGEWEYDEPSIEQLENEYRNYTKECSERIDNISFEEKLKVEKEYLYNKHKYLSYNEYLINVFCPYLYKQYQERVKKLRKKKRLKHFGMSSFTAQDLYSPNKDYRPSEGKISYIPYKGTVDNICQQIEGGIRSCCAYIGSQSIKDMGKCTTFVKVNRTHNNIYENNNVGSTEEYRNSENCNKKLD